MSSCRVGTFSQRIFTASSWRIYARRCSTLSGTKRLFAIEATSSQASFFELLGQLHLVPFVPSLCGLEAADQASHAALAKANENAVRMINRGNFVGSCEFVGWELSVGSMLGITFR
jgi:hypothetical protein